MNEIERNSMAKNLYDSGLIKEAEIKAAKTALLHESDISQLNLKPSTKIE
jgi:hypothetical protein